MPYSSVILTIWWLLKVWLMGQHLLYYSTAFLKLWGDNWLPLASLKMLILSSSFRMWNQSRDNPSTGESMLALATKFWPSIVRHSWQLLRTKHPLNHGKLFWTMIQWVAKSMLFQRIYEETSSYKADWNRLLVSLFLTFWVQVLGLKLSMFITLIFNTDFILISVTEKLNF